MSKAVFIHSLLPSVPVNEVVARAKSQGLNVTQGYVRWVRWQSKSAAKKQVTKPPKSELIRRQPGTPVPKSTETTSSAENLLKALGAELGLGHAIEILQRERERVIALLRR